VQLAPGKNSGEKRKLKRHWCRRKIAEREESYKETVLPVAVAVVITFCS